MRRDCFNHTVGWLQQESNLVATIGLGRFEEGLFELGPLLLVAFAHMALQLGGLLVLALAEDMWTFIWILALMAQFVGHKLDLIPKFLGANGAGQVALFQAI